jgi:hypothetical protein
LLRAVDNAKTDPAILILHENLQGDGTADILKPVVDVLIKRHTIVDFR